jgi:catechol 2,3-dioxygenase-like lactoylglutathione lyase family enzyme
MRGIPTARSVDHVGFTVPDLDEAVDFFTRVLGYDLVFRTGPVFDSAGGDWMERHYGLDKHAILRTAMLRCGLMNLELIAWTIPGSGLTQAIATGIGAAHLAIYVDDLEGAAAYLASQRGVRILGPRTVHSGEPNEGTEFVYVLLPWGMCLELVRWPTLMPYCTMTTTRLIRPRAAWEAPEADLRGA